MDLPIISGSSASSLIRRARRTEITEACVLVLMRLEALAAAIEAFRVTLHETDLHEIRIEVHFSDPLGKKGSHAISYRFKAGDPSSGDIADSIWSKGALPTKVHAHVQNGRAKLEGVGERFKALGSPN